jgi:hypothetical protein
VTVPPAGTLHFDAAGPLLALQRMSLLATEVTGLLPFGSLAQVDWWTGVSDFYETLGDYLSDLCR